MRDISALMAPGDQALLEELKKEVSFLREERDSLKNANKSLKVTAFENSLNFNVIIGV